MITLNSKEFLQLFNHKVYTLGFLSKKGMKTFPCIPQKLDKALTTLTNLNKDSEIYFMVNEGNGKLNEQKTACHSTVNVTNLSAIFLDAELPNQDPLPIVKKFCEKYFVDPSIIVNTSPIRYHIYWLLEPTPATKENVFIWQKIQSFLHSKLSSDRTMTDIPQLLRIPNFKNTKKDYLITAFSEDDTKHSLSELYMILKTHFPEIDSFRPFEPLSPVTDDYKVPEGERHEELLRRARKLYNLPLTDSEIKCFLDGFIQNHVIDNTDFRPSGKRYSEVERILQAAKTYAEKEKLDQASQIITKHVEHKKTKSEFELDPEFYYQAPDIVGEITRHIVDTSRTPIPAHAFAAAVSIVGFTKARFIEGYDHLPPISYFLCLAPSGSGKTTIQHKVKNIFKQLQISHLVEDGIASAQGLIQFIHEANGLGFILYDEVKDLFQTISSKYAASYEVKISTELTKLYTAYASTSTPPTTKTHKGKKIVLSKPILSFIGYGQHVLIDQLFSKSNVSDGLLPRFIILAVNNKAEHSSISQKLPQSILDELQYNLTKSCIAIEEKATQSDIPVNTTPVIKTLSYSNDAQTMYDQFYQYRTTLYNQAIADRNGLEALFSRGSEQVSRLALAMATNEIQAPIAKFCIDLVTSQMNSFYNQFSLTVNTTKHSKETDQLFETILDMTKDNKNQLITKQQLRLKIRHKFETGQFDKCLNELIQQGRITELSKSNPAGRQSIYLELNDPELLG